MRSTDKRLPAFLAAALAGALLPWAAGAVSLLISAGPTEEAVPEGGRLPGGRPNPGLAIGRSRGVLEKL